MIMSKEDLKKLIEELSYVFEKYGLKEIKCNIFETHPMINGKIEDKDLLHLTIKDVHGFRIEDGKFDVLKGKDVK